MLNKKTWIRPGRMTSGPARIAKRGGFTLIELLVVIAIIAILATIAVFSLQNARAKGRDARRVADVKQMQTALELFFNDQNRYPTRQELSGGSLAGVYTEGTTTYMAKIPTPPTPADGNCTNSSAYTYSQTDGGASYTISYCTGGVVGGMASGVKCASPAGINDGSDCIPFNCGEPLVVTSIAGHTCNTGAPDYDTCTYNTVQLGTQCWLRKNINVGSIINSSALPTNNSTLEKYCYNNDSATCQSEGALYEWNEAVNYDGSNRQGICPNGWHMPNSAAISELAANVCVAGDCANLLAAPIGNSGFDLLYSGRLDLGSGFNFGGTAGYFFTSSYSKVSVTAASAPYNLYNVGGGLDSVAWPVRCLKN